MTLSQFIQQLSTTPALWVTALLTLGVILVNGWTDAPNAIATCVATRAMKPRLAIAMAAVCNFLGVLVMTLLSPKVAETIYNMVDFGPDAREALALTWVESVPTTRPLTRPFSMHWRTTSSNNCRNTLRKDGFRRRSCETI